MVKNLPAMQEDLGLVPRSGRDPLEKENGNPLQFSCLGNPMKSGAWWVGYSPWGHKSQTQL